MRIARLGIQGAGKTAVFNASADNPVEVVVGMPQAETHVHVVTRHAPRLEVWEAPGRPAGTTEADRERKARGEIRIEPKSCIVLDDDVVQLRSAVS